MRILSHSLLVQPMGIFLNCEVNVGCVHCSSKLTQTKPAIFCPCTTQKLFKRAEFEIGTRLYPWLQRDKVGLGGGGGGGGGGEGVARSCVKC